MSEWRSNPSKVHVDGKKLSGYAAKFNSKATLPGFDEVVLPGAFRSSIKAKQDTVALFNHNPNFPLGRVSNGTLRLQEDHVGLAFECDLPNCSYADDLHESVKRGDVAGVSFAFLLKPEDQTWAEGRRGGLPLRSIRNVSVLQDVSPTVFPCYSDTEVQARSKQGLELTSAETRSALQTYLQSNESILAQSADFIRETLNCSWLYESEHPYKHRSFQDQMKLSAMAVEVSELRRSGVQVEVRMGADLMPYIFHAEKPRKTNLLEWMLN